MDVKQETNKESSRIECISATYSKEYTYIYILSPVFLTCLDAHMCIKKRALHIGIIYAF